MSKKIHKFQYGDCWVIQEIEELENGDKKVISRSIKGTLTDKYDDIRLMYCLAVDKVLSLKEFFEVIVGDRFSKKDYVMEIYRDYEQKRHCKSIQELMKYSKWANHFVPNTFYKWHDRSLENMRCIQWMTFDFELRKSDGQAFSTLQVWEIFRKEIGFTPTIITESKTSGNYHVYLKHTTLNGSIESSHLFKRIQTKIAQKIGTDPGALGANHNFAIPKRKIFYFGDNTIDFNELKAWWIQILKEEHGKAPKRFKPDQKVTSLTEHLIWNHPAVQKLMNNEYDGHRNQAGFTLALLFYAMGKSESETREYLLNEWFPLVSQVGKKYHLSELKASIRSAFTGKYAGPSKEKIEALTGIEFNVRIYKSQYKRQKLHNKNENQYAIINYFRQRNGKVKMIQKELIEDICKTQSSSIGKPFSIESIKRNLRKLKEDNVINWESKGSGGNTKIKETEFILNEGVRIENKTIIEEDDNVYAFGKVIDLN